MKELGPSIRASSTRIPRAKIAAHPLSSRSRLGASFRSDSDARVDASVRLTVGVSFKKRASVATPSARMRTRARGARPRGATVLPSAWLPRTHAIARARARARTRCVSRADLFRSIEMCAVINRRRRAGRVLFHEYYRSTSSVLPSLPPPPPTLRCNLRGDEAELTREFFLGSFLILRRIRSVFLLLTLLIAQSCRANNKTN